MQMWVRLAAMFESAGLPPIPTFVLEPVPEEKAKVGLGVGGMAGLTRIVAGPAPSPTTASRPRVSPRPAMLALVQVTCPTTPSAGESTDGSWPVAFRPA